MSTIKALENTIENLRGILAQQEANLVNNPDCKGTRKAVEAMKKAIVKVEAAKVKTENALRKAGM